MFGSQKKQKPVSAAEAAEYSKDADQTRYIRLCFLLALITLVGLFALEFYHPDDHTPLFFTSEICHILINGIILAFGGLSGYIFGKSAGASEALMKMGGNGGNGMNGNGQQSMNQTTENSKQNGK